MNLDKFLEISCLSYNRGFRWIFQMIGSRTADSPHDLNDSNRDRYYQKYAEQELKDAKKFDEKFKGYLKIKGVTVLDLGSGFGGQGIHMALNKAEQVEGVEIDAVKIKASEQFAQKYGVSQKIRFSMSTDTHLPFEDEKFHLIVCNNVFEHLIEPQEILKECYRVLKKEGLLFISFGPPWYHPYGVHVRDIFSGPWNHLLFPEKVVVKIRNDFKKDEAGNTYADIGLAQLSVKKFKNLVRKSNFKIRYMNLPAIKNLNFLRQIPLLNELFISEVRCVLKK